MLTDSPAFSGFSVNDLETARRFYEETLGLRTSDAGMDGLMQLHLGGDTNVLVYAKADHTPATYTVLNFPVEDVPGTVAELRERGVPFERYEGTDVQTDDDYVFRGGGPLIAWFTDPGGNILSIIAAS